jgi:hypothetical protein
MHVPLTSKLTEEEIEPPGGWLVIDTTWISQPTTIYGSILIHIDPPYGLFI